MRKTVPIAALLVSLIMVFMSVPASAGGATKIDMRDQTQNGIGAGDPDIGFAIYHQNAGGTLIIQLSLKGAVPDATLEVQLVITGPNPEGGITPEPGGHYGLVNVLGTVTTNGAGNGNAHFNVDVATLMGPLSGATNYGHIDCEDDDGAVSPGILDYGLVDNQYGGSVVEWEQP
jgi:hypothetical protein